MMSIITSLINIAAGGGWMEHPFLHILLMIDGVIYQLVSYAFNLFLLMCSVNYNSIAGLASGLIDSLKAVIMVLVVYKLGISLLQFMLKPEEAASGSKNIVINIFITAALLISYNFIFSVFNELGMLIMGNPTNYPYTTLSTIADVKATSADNKGLIMRFVFQDSAEEIDDVGDFLSYSTMSIFLHDYGNEESSTHLQNEICDDEGNCDFSKMKNLSADIGQTVEYHWGIAGLVGIYLIWSIVKSAIQIGIRMFKLLILQLIAPVAIITIIKDGTKSSTFQKYIKTYGSVFADAFIRMLTMLIIVVFVCKFFINKTDFFGSLSAEGGWVNFLITVILVIAAFKFAGDVPKFISELFPGVNIGGDSKGGFGKVLSGIIGGGIGAVAGLAGGIAGGINAGAGALGTVGNAFAGAASGAASGIKGNKISDKVKNISASAGKGNLTRAQNIAAAGGLSNILAGGVKGAAGVGKRLDTKIGKFSDAAKALEAYDSGTSALLKQRGTTAKDIKNDAFRSKLSNFGSAAAAEKMKSKDEYKSVMRQHHKGLQEAIARRENMVNNGLTETKTRALTSAERSQLSAQLARHEISRGEYDRLMSDGVTETIHREATESELAAISSEIARLQQESDKDAGDLYEAARKELVDEGGHAAYLDSNARDAVKASGVTVVTDDFGGVDVKKSTAAVDEAKYAVQDSSSYVQTHLPRSGGK